MAVRKRNRSDDSEIARLEFEVERQNLLRTFEVQMMDGTTEHVFAHYHDAGGSGGCLSFVTIGALGEHRISRVIAVHALKSLKEIIVGERQVVDDGAQRMAS